MYLGSLRRAHRLLLIALLGVRAWYALRQRSKATVVEGVK
jgi:hypothetical protein